MIAQQAPFVVFVMNARCHGDNLSLDPPVKNGYWFTERRIPISDPNHVREMSERMAQDGWELKEIVGIENAENDLRNLIAPFQMLLASQVREAAATNERDREVAGRGKAGSNAGNLSRETQARGTAPV